MEADRAARVAAVGVDQHDLPAVLAAGPVQVQPDRVVERRETARLLLPDPLDEPRELVLAVARRAHFGVEVDDGDVDGVGQRVEELDRRGLGEGQVLAHAPADVEHQAEVHRRRGVVAVAGREVADRLLPAVLVDLEVVERQVGDEVSFPVGDGGADVDEVDARPEAAAPAGRAHGTRASSTSDTTEAQRRQGDRGTRRRHGAHDTWSSVPVPLCPRFLCVLCAPGAFAGSHGTVYQPANSTGV